MGSLKNDPVESLVRGQFAPSSPRVSVPALACDCHVHVFGPYARFPLMDGRAYSPPEALREDLESVLDTLGVDRVVLVQPSTYGTDNRCMLDALEHLGNRARGIAVVDESVTDDELATLHAAGVRGARINARAGTITGAVAVGMLSVRIAARIASFGWHLQLYLATASLPAVAPVLASLPVPVVLDHFADVPRDPARSAHSRTALFDLLETGRCWVKISASDRFPASSTDSVAELARDLVACRSDRVVWGSDWPHTRGADDGRADPGVTEPFRDVDTGRVLDLVASWLPDAALRRRVLTENPSRLYEFDR